MKRVKSFEHSSICYLIATPIGNLDDITLRALKILKEVDYIACEDTRTTSSLLKNYGISGNFISYHEHNEQASSSKIIELLKDNKKIALTSDAGYPGISDPGAILVRHCIDNDIPVSLIPGANASLPALIGSGLDNDHYTFYGFLKSKPSARKNELKELINHPFTLIFYESPHRILETLEDMFNILGDRKVCLCRELTKLHEEYIYGPLSELVLLKQESLRGEMVIVVEKNLNTTPSYSDEELIKMLKEEQQKGLSLKDASKLIQEKTGIKKNYIYQLGLK